MPTEYCATELLTWSVSSHPGQPGWRVWEQWEWPWLESQEAWILFLLSLFPAALVLTLCSSVPTMAFPGRARPCAIPENEEIPRTVLNSVQEVNGNEDERAVSKLQRRHSDVKVYKEFCDFYAKLWVFLPPGMPLPDPEFFSSWFRSYFDLANMVLFSRASAGLSGALRVTHNAACSREANRLPCHVKLACPGRHTDVKENAVFTERVVSSCLK